MPRLVSLVLNSLFIVPTIFAQGVVHESAWPTGIERVWPGPDYSTNRFLDWRVRDGRLECVTGHRGRPMRTCVLLTATATLRSGSLEMVVETGSLVVDRPRHANTWTGFIIGIGGDDVDYRTSALCHHWPAPDGGLIAAVDGTGRAVFRSNSTFSKRRPQKLEAWPLLPNQTHEGPGFGERDENKDENESRPTSFPTLNLKLAAHPDGEGTCVITLEAHDTDHRLISRAQVTGVDPGLVDGLVALCSHSVHKRGGPGYWFRDWVVRGTKTETRRDRTFGPVWSAMHTLSDDTLKMTAQMAPLGPSDTREARLELRDGTVDADEQPTWREAARGILQDHSNTIPFRVQYWQGDRDVPYRIVYDLKTGPKTTVSTTYSGVIRAVPHDKNELTLAALSCHHISAKGIGHWNGGSIWYPHNELVRHVEAHDPDIVFFAGDQIYEGGLAGIIRNPPELACDDYLYHWVRWCWAFRDLFRDRPCVVIPDDHDVYHGNIWGAGGKKAVKDPKRSHLASDSGGYIMDPLFVNAVHRTQVSHLPDPVDPTPIDQNITVYHTKMDYAGLSFGIIADRMFKSSATVMVPEGKCINGWFRNPDFDARTSSDVDGAVLLGKRQLDFLEQWTGDWRRNTTFKVLLSQTIFANIATLPKTANNDGVVPSLEYADPGDYIDGDQLAADTDSNGWPQTPRNNALRILRKGFAFHIAGDQHLASFTRYGVDDWGDAGFAFCVPAIANVWPRRWFPPEPGKDREAGAPVYTGDFLDGFGNRVTVRAVANPVRSGMPPEALNDRMPGYGIVRFDKKKRTITSECWPRWVDPTEPDAKQFDGWPITVRQDENYGRKPVAWLPEIRVLGMSRPVVQVVEEATKEVVYTLRLKTPSWQPPVFSAGRYTIRIGEPGTPRWATFGGIEAKTDRGGDDVTVVF